MLRINLFFLFILTLGKSISQVSFYISPELYAKMSFNSTHPINWDSKTYEPSNLFSYEHRSFCLTKPLRVGLSTGIKFNEKHEISLGLHTDGVSSNVRLRFGAYDEVLGLITPKYFKVKSQTTQSKIFLAYKYNFLSQKNKSQKNKTTLSIMPSIGLVRRAGLNEIESVGSFGGSSLLNENDLIIKYNNGSFTSNLKRVFVFGIGLSSDVFITKKYLLTFNLQYSHTPGYLYQEATNVEIENTNTGESTKYGFYQYNRSSGLYFSMSRKFQLFLIVKKKKINL